MKHLKDIPVYLLAIVFLVFGSNFFLHFIPLPPMTGDAGTFGTLLYTTGYMTVVKVLEVSVGILLFIPVTRALALLLIAPIAVNILLFELLIAHQPGIGILLIILIAWGIYVYRAKYIGIVKS